nr:hypothetical protein [Tanacetum cinerariifolium]
NQNSLNDSPRISETSSQSPPNINHCCYECGDPLDGIFCKRCTYKSCGKDAHIGYNCSSKVPVISIPEPCNNQTTDELPQTLPIFHLTFHFEAESSFTVDLTPTYVDESPNVFNPPPQPPVNLEEKRIEETQAAKAQNWKFLVCYDDDDDEEEYNSLNDNIISELPSIGQHHFNAESDLVESLLNRDSSIIFSSSKIDSLLDEFAGELTLLKSIPPGIDETDYHPENEIRLSQRLLYDNSSPRPLEEFDLTFTSDDPMPPSNEEDDDDSRDTLIRKELFDNYSLPIPENELFHFDIPSFSRPPAKPPDDGDTGILNIKMMGDISDQKPFMHQLMITLAPHQEKSPDLLSHRCRTVKKFNTYRSHLNKCPMLIHGQSHPSLDVLLFYFYPP